MNIRRLDKDNEIRRKKSGLDIKYGELDIYFPLKIDSSAFFEENTAKVAKCFGEFLGKCIDNNKKVNKEVLNKEYKIMDKRSKFINEECFESIGLYGTVYTNSQERLLLFPLKVELYNKQCVWLNAILYIFKNNMGILKIELPLINVSNEFLKRSDFNAYICKANCEWNRQSYDLHTFDEIKNMYLDVIHEFLNIEISECGDFLHHIILVDFEGCPYNVVEIDDEVQEELFKTIAGTFHEGPYTSYLKDAKEYISNNSWGSHNVRCIIKSTGGCLSILDRTVQDYWIKKNFTDNGKSPTDIECIDMYEQYIHMIQNNTEFPLVILMLKRINVLDSIRRKSTLSNNDKLDYEYLRNKIFISSIQEECCGTVCEQLDDFERMMRHYLRNKITDEKYQALNDILHRKKQEKEERFQRFISIGGIIFSLSFSLPAIRETVMIIRSICWWIKGDIPIITQDNFSVFIWIIFNVFIVRKLFLYNRKEL